MGGFAEHLSAPVGRGHVPDGAATGAAGGAACGDVVRVSVAVAGERVAGAGFDASGCGATLAAGSAAVSLVRGCALLDALRVGPDDIADELGGLSPGKRHAAELAADALHRALGAAVRDAARLGADPANDGERSCCSAQAVRGARALARRMGIPHVTLDLREEFRAGVVQPFLDDHAAGLTPNPCVRCNGHVRFDAMLALAERLGAARLATGHYARIARDVQGPLVRAAEDAHKDQAYMLAQLRPEQLERLWFPLGELAKPEVRALARAAELPVADRAESQDLCFLAGAKLDDFVTRRT
ncbi:MAG TPA: iron-sulfur cluster assembly scaffold protein, partial [Solirubrobacteraceae bacterium]